MFANGLEDLCSIPDHVIPKTLKMVLDTSLLNTQEYKVRIKDKWSNSGKGVAPSPTHGCSSYCKRELSGRHRPRSPTFMLFWHDILYCGYNFFAVMANRWEEDIVKGSRNKCYLKLPILSSPADQKSVLFWISNSTALILTHYHDRLSTFIIFLFHTDKFCNTTQMYFIYI